MIRRPGALSGPGEAIYASRLCTATRKRHPQARVASRCCPQDELSFVRDLLACRLSYAAAAQPGIVHALDFPMVRFDFFHRYAAVLAPPDLASVDMADFVRIDPMAPEGAGDQTHFH